MMMSKTLVLKLAITLLICSQIQVSNASLSNMPTSSSPQHNNFTNREIIFALIPKTIDNPFFDVSRDGCMDQAERISKEMLAPVKCIYPGPTSANATEQVNLIRSLIETKAVDGIAVSAIDAAALVDVIEEASSANIPVVTFDSDAPQTKRISYIGTDNGSFGERLGKVLKQIQPMGGTFRMVSIPEPNILQRERGVRSKLLEEGWIEAGAPSNMKGNSTLVVEQMFQFMEEDPMLKAIVPVMGAGMRSPIWTDFVKAYPDVLLVVSDAMPNQLELLNRAYCNGLVGQLPHEMGVKSIQALYELYSNQTSPDDMPEFIATNVLEHLRIPLTLPELVKDYNLVGELRYVGYTLFVLVACMSIAFMGWAYLHRQERVVKVAQPQFLIMVALGSLIMCSAILPLGFDDHTSFTPNHKGIIVCMTPMWLLIVGFSLTYSSLFAKIHRVNLIFKSGDRFARVQMKQREVWIPLCSLLLANGGILLSWTLIDPLKYIRLDEEGLDGWDRPISSYGTCQSENPVPFLVPLGLLNGIVLAFANWSAYEARSISIEFAESKYVAMAMASLFQALISGVPVLVLVRMSPQAFYMVLVFMIFVISSAILLLIFVPKVVAYFEFKRQSDDVRRKAIEKSIRDSGKRMRRSSVFRYSSWQLESERELISQENESSPELTTHHDTNNKGEQSVSESKPSSQSLNSSENGKKSQGRAETSEAFALKSKPPESTIRPPLSNGSNRSLWISSQSLISVLEDEETNERPGNPSKMWDSNKSLSMKSVSETLVTEKLNASNGKSSFAIKRENPSNMWDSNKSLSMKSVSETLVTEKSNASNNGKSSFAIKPLTSLSEVMEKNQAMWNNNSVKSPRTTKSLSEDLRKDVQPGWTAVSDKSLTNTYSIRQASEETKDGKLRRMDSDDSILSA